MDNLDEILEKYSERTINNLDRHNISKIIVFLSQENCDYIEDLLEDYLDLFTIEYNEFINKYHKLNKKYHNEYLRLASSDMNLFEEFFYD